MGKHLTSITQKRTGAVKDQSTLELVRGQQGRPEQDPVSSALTAIPCLAALHPPPTSPPPEYSEFIPRGLPTRVPVPVEDRAHSRSLH